jgi:hypothetical protein
MYSGHLFMYLNPCRVAPSPQFGLLVTGTGKRLLYGCSFILTWSLGQFPSPSSGYSRTQAFQPVLDFKSWCWLLSQPTSGFSVNLRSATSLVSSAL